MAESTTPVSNADSQLNAADLNQFHSSCHAKRSHSSFAMEPLGIDPEFRVENGCGCQL